MVKQKTFRTTVLFELFKIFEQLDNFHNNFICTLLEYLSDTFKINTTINSFNHIEPWLNNCFGNIADTSIQTHKILCDVIYRITWYT